MDSDLVAYQEVDLELKCRLLHKVVCSRIQFQHRNLHKATFSGSSHLLSQLHLPTQWDCLDKVQVDRSHLDKACLVKEHLRAEICSDKHQLQGLHHQMAVCLAIQQLAQQHLKF